MESINRTIDYKNIEHVFRKLKIKLIRPKKLFHVWLYYHFENINIDIGLLFWESLAEGFKLFFSKIDVEEPDIKPCEYSLTIDGYIKYCINWPSTMGIWENIIKNEDNYNSVIVRLLETCTLRNNLSELYTLKYNLK